MNNLKYEYYLYTWGGFYNPQYKDIHKEEPGAKWFDTNKERDSYIAKLRKIEIKLQAKHLVIQVGEGYNTRIFPTCHRITEYEGVRKYTTDVWNWPVNTSVLKFHMENKWFPGCNDYPFGEDFKHYNKVKIVQEWITGAFDVNEEY